MAAINKRKLLESAQKNLQKGALDKALKDYQELLAADPRDSNVRLKVGDLQLKRGNADDAITAYLKVADQFMRDGFDAKAVAIYKQVLRIDEKRVEVHIPLADLYQRLGLTTDAMAAIQTAAEAYQRDGKRREALELLRRMASLDPTNTTSRIKVAELLHQEDLDTEAIAEFEEAAAELERQGDWEGRAAVLERLIEVAPSRFSACDALIAIWMERNQAARAEPLARRLIDLDPSRAESHEALATALAARGAEAGAIEAYRAAADAWRARGEEERARQILQRHVPTVPFDAAGVQAGAVTNPITESPFGEEGIGGEPPPVVDEFRFVGDAEPAPVAAADDFELEVDESVVAPTPPPAAAPEPIPVAAPASPPAAAPAAVAPPVAVAVADEPEVELGVADVEQLVAEAAVYLRYGKHERALASLQQALAHEPRHLGVLEQLGEAHLRADASADAVIAWSRAHDTAVARGDTERASAIAARITAIDAAWAPPARAAAAATVLLDAPAPPAADAAPAPDDEIEIEVDDAEISDGDQQPALPESGDSGQPALADADEPALEETPALELVDEVEEPPEFAADETPAASAETGGVAEAASESFEAPAADGDVEIEIDAADFAEPTPEAAAGEPEADDVPVPDSFELAGESASEGEGLSFESNPQDGVAAVAAEASLDVAPADTTEPDAGPALAPAPAAAATSPPAGSDVSSTTAQQVLEDLEEASFYFEQGLFDEAEAIYQRVVERAPQHPAALLRLGEIAAARGQDPSASAANAPDVEADATEVAEAADAAPTIDPPDDLDLTAREFGPHREWEDAASESEEDPVAAPAEPGADTGAKAGLDPTDPAEWTTPDGVATRGIEPPVCEAAAASDATPPSAPEPPPLEMTAPEIRSEEDGAAAFDLAAELSEALRDEPATPARSGSTDEDGFAALFQEFKRGVSRTLDEGDVETHFDLGIAYREMGLLDDAIGEFRYALGSSARRLDALHMMGVCALEVGRPADSIGHFEQALASPAVPDDREAPLRYDLARAYEAQGDRERALDAFARVVELDASFQDATERLEALRANAVSDDAECATSEGEAYESFDDLIAQSADETSVAASAEAAVVAETYESFDEFHGNDDDEASDAAVAGGACDVAVDDEGACDVAVDDEGECDVAVAEAPEAESVEVAVEPEPEPAPEPEPPAAEEPPRRRRKISFF